jgi:hypothetical protein
MVLQVIFPAISAGILHVLLGPDHICAIMTVSACQGSAALWHGFRWGVGHSVGLILVALLMYFLDDDPTSTNDVFTTVASYFSGAFMIALGSYFIRDILANDKSGLGFSALSTDDSVATIEPVEHPEEDSEPSESPIRSRSPRTEKAVPSDSASNVQADSNEKPSSITRMKQAAASLIAGIVGGIAGPGGVLAIVPASYYATQLESITYISIFIVASTLTMGGCALAYGRITSSWVMNSFNRQRQETKLKLISSIASVAVGIVWIILTALDVLNLD